MSRKSDKTPADAATADEVSADLDGLDFESALDALESIVAELESGELSLEASLAAFERGVKLTRRCQAALKAAELRVQVLTEDGALDDFDPDDADDD